MNPINPTTSSNIGSKAGSAFLTAVSFFAIVGVSAWAIYDKETHGKQWFWNRWREENALRMREGLPKVPLIEQITALFKDESKSW